MKKWKRNEKESIMRSQRRRKGESMRRKGGEGQKGGSVEIGDRGEGRKKDVELGKGGWGSQDMHGGGEAARKCRNL